MANKELWAAEAVSTLLVAELNNLVDETLAIDAATYDNATNKFRWADFLFKATAFDAQVDAGAYIELHIFYQLDGTFYGDGEEGDGATPVPTVNSLHGVFWIPLTTGPVYQQVLRVPLNPFVLKAGIIMYTGQDLTAVATHFLKICPYNEELQ